MLLISFLCEQQLQLLAQELEKIMLDVNYMIVADDTGDLKQNVINLQLSNINFLMEIKINLD